MPGGAFVPRSTLAYEVSRRLMCFSGCGRERLSVVKAAKENLDKLLAAKRIMVSEHRQLSHLFNSLEGCDMDRYERVDDLVQEVTRLLTVWPEVFPDQELERLRCLPVRLS
jgi:hypothetical protein